MEGCNSNEEDIISKLPDDILISIISRLSFQEATATSILSSRWRHLCTRITSLNFCLCIKQPMYYSVRDFKLYWEQAHEEVPYFVDRINQTLDLYKDNPSVTQFRVEMPCLRRACTNVKYWLDFVFSRKFQVVNINLFCRRFIIPSRQHCCWHYPFSVATLINNKESLLGLKELSLSAFAVEDSEVELLLSNCVVLERLSIEFSISLQYVRVVGQSVLKHLNISDCPKIRSVEVRRMSNLVSLRCYRLPRTYRLLLDYAPKLIEFSTSCPIMENLAQVLPRILSYKLDQLQVLKFSTNFLEGCDDSTVELPKLTNLKHLELEIRMNSKCRNDIHKLIPLIEACPSLKKLEMKFSWPVRAWFTRYKPHEARSGRCVQNYSLKKVKLVGYFGSASEKEFAMYVVNNAVALEQVTVHVYDETSDLREMATIHARQDFQSITSKSVKLSIH